MFRAARDRPSPPFAWAGLFLAWLILTAQPVLAAFLPGAGLAQGARPETVICHAGGPERGPARQPHPAWTHGSCALCFAAFGAELPSPPELPGPALRADRPPAACQPPHDTQIPLVASAQARAPPPIG